MAEKISKTRQDIISELEKTHGHITAGEHVEPGKAVVHKKEVGGRVDKVIAYQYDESVPYSKATALEPAFDYVYAAADEHDYADTVELWANDQYAGASITTDDGLDNLNMDGKKIEGKFSSDRKIGRVITSDHRSRYFNVGEDGSVDAGVTKKVTVGKDKPPLLKLNPKTDEHYWRHEKIHEATFDLEFKNQERARRYAELITRRAARIIREATDDIKARD